MDSAARERVTLATETIHNPSEPRHFMRLKPVAGRIRVLCGGELLAESHDVVRLLEAGRDLYDPTLYLPRSDVGARLSPVTGKETYCPLKGHASYFDLLADDGTVRVAEIAWCYERTVDRAEGIRGRIAFYPSKVAVEEYPA